MKHGSTIALSFKYKLQFRHFYNHLLLLQHKTQTYPQRDVNYLQSLSVSETASVSLDIFVSAICAPPCPSQYYISAAADSLLWMSHEFAVNFLCSDDLCMTKQAAAVENQIEWSFPCNEWCCSYRCSLPHDTSQLILQRNVQMKEWRITHRLRNAHSKMANNNAALLIHLIIALLKHLAVLYMCTQWADIDSPDPEAAEQLLTLVGNHGSALVYNLPYVLVYNVYSVGVKTTISDICRWWCSISCCAVHHFSSG